MFKNNIIAVVLPAYNEALSIKGVIADLMALKNEAGEPLVDQLVVCNNNSTDATANIAQQAGAQVVTETQQGYGAACLCGLSVLKHPDIIVFVDADGSVQINEMPMLLNRIIEGNDLVIGSRTLGKAQVGSLSPQQKMGNLLACFLIRQLWHHPITDLGPFRAIRYDALQHLHMADRQFGWTVEMQVKAIQLGLPISEVPVTNLQRIGRSKISGTVSGTIGAGKGILGMIAKLWLQQKTCLFKNVSTL